LTLGFHNKDKSGQVAKAVHSTLGGRKEMETLTKAYVKVREYGKKLTKGQTMTEYALILAAVAVVVFVTYEVMGQKINTLVNFIDSDLSAAAS